MSISSIFRVAEDSHSNYSRNSVAPAQKLSRMLRRAEVLRRAELFRLLNIRTLLFIAMLGVSSLPVLAFYKWAEQSAFQKEVESAREHHLIIAQNLSTAMSRYVADLKAVFSIGVEQTLVQQPSISLQNALSKFNICEILIYGADDQIKVTTMGAEDHNHGLPDFDNLTHLRSLAEQANGEIVISGIRDHHGEPYFFAVQLLENDQLAVAPWAPDYIVGLQKSIAFGELGHSMVVDHLGRVVAHPNAEWQAKSQDASKLSVVQAMLAQTTGVMQFYSPPMDAQMIAGYTYVPETGWGVMVPQPLRELEARAKEAESTGLQVAILEIILVALFAYWLSGLITRPLMAITASAEDLSKGKLSSRISRLSSYTPREFKLLASSFNKMARELQKKTEYLQGALVKAEINAHENARLLEEARRANSVKSQFVAMVSHELKTPLTSIKASLDLLGSGRLGPLPEKADTVLGISRRNSDRLAKMIEDLLDLETLDDKSLQFEFQKTDIQHLAHDAVETNRAFADQHGVSLSFNTVNGAGIYAECDPDRILQVMTNLLSNAAKFSPAGSTVEISVEAFGDTVKVSVSDNGIGIPDGLKDKVFERFVQLDQSDVRNAGGSGLGLSIATQIIAAHNGTLDYTSEVGKGTTFTFILPLSQGQE